MLRYHRKLVVAESEEDDTMQSWHLIADPTSTTKGMTFFFLLVISHEEKPNFSWFK